MAGTEYVLTGFDIIPYRQRVVFVEPLPSSRVCGVCGVVPSRSILLPCGHFLCQVCKGQIPKENETCPLDNKEFADADAVPITFKQSQLEDYRVFCIAGDRECNFAGKMRDLKDHLTGCGSNKVRCAKCQQSVLGSVAVEHYRQCSANTPPRHFVSVMIISGAVLKLGYLKKDLDSVRELVSSDKADKNAIVNGVNSLMERVANLERDLIHAEKEANGEQCVSSEPGLKKMVVPSGPYRAASKLGAFITTCKFADVYAGYNTLTGSKKEHWLETTTYTLAGYTFYLRCKLKKNDETVTLRFILHLKEGDWDCVVRWPFAKKIAIILTHPVDEEKDIRMPVVLDDPKMVKKPGGSGNWGRLTDSVNWMDIEVQGFFNKKTLYVNVEFE